MKNALIRLLALATLATSVSAFAAAGKSKQDGAANTSASQQQSGCAGSNADQDKEQKKAQKAQNESQEEKDFDSVLMGIYG